MQRPEDHSTEMTKYFLHRNNANHGPYPEDQLRQMIATDQIAPGELISAGPHRIEEARSR
ncbi:MAG: GYF domain-containing protein [Akkermansiaceae bacterium]|jgi:hypothetical protein